MQQKDVGREENIRRVIEREKMKREEVKEKLRDREAVVVPVSLTDSLGRV